MQKIKVLLFFLLISSGLFSTLFAAGTASGTTISTSATLTFGDSIETSTTVTSNTDTFVVDNKIDMTVTTLDAAAVQTRPQESAVVLKFKVTNTGNSVQDYSLQALSSSTSITLGGETLSDNFDATNVQVVVDNGDGVYNAADDTQTYIDELAPDSEATVFIVADMPDGLSNNDVAIYDLQVQVAHGGAPNTQGDDITSDSKNDVENPLTVQIVFADGSGSLTGDVQRDGKMSNASAYKIVIADMQIVKSSIVISDPINGTTNPKRIPGAVIRYCYTVTNSGGADATIANISDDLDETKFDFTNFDNNAIKIYTGSDQFECSNADNLTTTTNTGSVNSATGVIEIVLDGVNANASKSAYFDITLK